MVNYIKLWWYRRQILKLLARGGRANLDATVPYVAKINAILEEEENDSRQRAIGNMIH